MGGRLRRVHVRWLTALLAVPVLAMGLVAGQPSGATTAPAGPLPLDLARPRILGAGSDLNAIAARLNREPYRTIFLRLAANARGWNAVALDDHTIGSERVKAKATKDNAFQYAINRTVVAGEPAPFPTAEARQATGDAARDVLLNMYTRSRLVVPAPLGGDDRDINTSEELLQYSTAYDSLKGAGYPFTATDEATIRSRITDLASEFYNNYFHPESAGGLAETLPNNHRSKSAAALGTAALALLESSPPQGAPPDDIRSPAAWLTFALDQIEVVEGWTFTAADGAYGEGPYYERYAAQNLLPFARAWNHAAHGQSWDVGGRQIHDLWTSPGYRRTHQWLLDTTLPNGALAPIDDGNVDFSYYFGAAPTDASNAAAFAWRWANAPTPYDTDGSVDLSADSVIAYDDSVVPAPPSGSPTRFYAEGGNAVFRSGWDADATMAVVLGEHGAAMELGRDRSGLGKFASAAHEQPDTGSFTLGSFGEKLLLDPGYMTYPERGLVGKATNHNMILVNGQGPKDPFLASIFWNSNFAGPPPVDGQATITETRDTPFLDTARVTSSYADTKVDRRFFFVDDRYVLVADKVQSTPTKPTILSWQLHGNGGGTSGGTFTQTPFGGEWVHGGARLDSGFATTSGPIFWATRETNHEDAGRVLKTHTTLDAHSGALAPTTYALSAAYPTRVAQAAPTITTAPTAGGGTSIRIDDPAGDRSVDAVIGGDGTIAIRDRHSDGSIRVRYTEAKDGLGQRGGPSVSSRGARSLGLRVTPTSADLLAQGPSHWIRTHGLAFTPRAADGACRISRRFGTTHVQTIGDGVVTLRPDSGNSAPGADAGTDRDGVAVGSEARLWGRGCDVNRDRLTPHWEVVAAPPGSASELRGASGWTPALVVDAAGPYRVRLTVTDSRGATSRRSEVEIYGGPRCTGDRLTWSDPRCP